MMENTSNFTTFVGNPLFSDSGTGFGYCAEVTAKTDADQFLSAIIDTLLGTGLYLAAFVCASVLIAIALVILGKTGIFWTMYELQSGLNTCANQETDGSEPVNFLSELDIADPTKKNDVTGPRLENPFPLPFTKSLFGGFIVDEKDLPLLDMLVSACFVLVPMAALCYVLFLYAPFGVATVYGFGVYQYVRVGYFMHGLLHFRHFASHRPLFRSKIANILPNLFLDPLMGLPPLVFMLHHPIMHHVANNGKYDISSTESYQRDDWVAFARY